MHTRPELSEFQKLLRQGLLLTVSELKNNFPFLEALSTVMCTQYCKKQMSLEAHYNKNIKLTIDKPGTMPHLNHGRATLISKEDMDNGLI